MLSKITSAFAATKSSVTSSIATRGAKKRGALSDISNQPAVAKAAKARRSDTGATASTASKHEAVVEETVEVSDVTVAVPEIAPSTPAVVDIYAGEDAKAYRELVSDFFSYLKSLESTTAITQDYMKTKQVDVSPAMRAILIDWLVEVAEEYKLTTDTVFVCTSLIDRCLSKFTVNRSNLQLLGCACMLLAAKYEEIYSPSVEEFVYISDNSYTRDQVLQMESAVLMRLNFRLATATSKKFLYRYVKAAGFTEREAELVHYFAELTLQEYEFVAMTPSVIAAACVLYGRLVMNCDPAWTPELEHYTGYHPRDLWPCVLALAKIHEAAPSNSLHAVLDKYSTPQRYFVSTSYHHVSARSLETAGVALGVAASSAAPRA